MIKYKVSLTFNENGKTLNETLIEVLISEIKNKFKTTCNLFQLKSEESSNKNL